MSKMQLKAKLVKKEQLKDDIFKFSVEAQEIVNIAKPGQFLEIRVTDQVEPFLRRPISIYNLDRENGILEFIFQVKGKGTKILAQKQEGELIDIIGPLGNGAFEYSKYQNLAIIGGGIGIFPLYELAKEAKLDGKNVNTYLGFRNKEFVTLEEVTNGSEFVDKTIKEWLENVEPEKREQVIDVVFDILNATDAQTMKETKNNWFTSARTMMASYKNIDNETKDMIWKAVGELLKSAKNNIFEDFPKLPEKSK